MRPAVHHITRVSNWIANLVLFLLVCLITLPLLSLVVRAELDRSAGNARATERLRLDSATDWRVGSTGSNVTERQAYYFDGQGLALAPLATQSIRFPRFCPDRHVVTVDALVDDRWRVNLLLNDRAVGVMTSNDRQPAVRFFSLAFTADEVEAENTFQLNSSSFVHVDRLTVECQIERPFPWVTALLWATDNQPRPVSPFPRSADWFLAIDSLPEWRTTIGNSVEPEFVPFFHDGQGVRVAAGSTLHLPKQYCQAAVLVRIISYQGTSLEVNGFQPKERRIDPIEKRILEADYLIVNPKDRLVPLVITTQRQVTVDALTARCVPSPPSPKPMLDEPLTPATEE